MNNLNRCEFIGNLTRDPEIRYTPDGSGVASFSLAVNWKSKNKEGAEFVNFSAFGKLSEIVEKYCKKGDKLYVSGKFKTEKFTDKNGIEKYATKIMANEIEMLGNKQHEEKQPEKPVSESSSLDEMQDDIPF